KCGDESKHAPRDEVFVSTIRVSGLTKASCSKVLPAKSEIRIENPHIEREPNRIEDVLHRHTVGPESEIRVQQFPRKIQRQCIKRNRVRLVAKADANPIEVNDRPADATDDGKNYLNRVDVNHQIFRES